MGSYSSTQCVSIETIAQFTEQYTDYFTDMPNSDVLLYYCNDTFLTVYLDSILLYGTLCM